MSSGRQANGSETSRQVIPGNALRWGTTNPITAHAGHGSVSCRKARPGMGSQSPGEMRGQKIVRAEVELIEKGLPPPPRMEVTAQGGGVEVVHWLADEWRALCDEGSHDQPFYRPEWIGAYVNAFASEQTLQVITARSGGRLRAVLPLLEERTFFCGLLVKKLRGAANVHSCRFDLVRAAGPDGEAAVEAIWNFLRDLPGWDVLELPDVPLGGSVEQLLAAAEKEGYPTARRESLRSPYLLLPQGDSGEESWLWRTDAKFRANLRRRRRNLATRGTLRLRRVETADPDALQRVLELEKSGWKGRAGSAIACNPKTRQFYEGVARRAQQFGYLALYFLELDARPIACHFGLAHRGRYFLPKPAYDEKYREFSPGQLLVNAVLRDCAERGFSEFDFLGPWMEWKGEWTSEVRPHAFCYIFNKSPLGWALWTTKFKLKSVVKSWLGVR